MTTPATRPRGQRDLAQARRTVVVAAGIAAVVIAADYPFLGVLAIARRGLVVVSFLPWRLTTYSRPADPLPGVVPIASRSSLPPRSGSAGAASNAVVRSSN